MAQDLQPNALEGTVTPPHFMPPSARELRSQAMHRLQVGLFGLCAMLLLVVLANIVMDRARLVEEDNPVVTQAPLSDKPQKPAVDPLADIGVVPGAGTPSPALTPGPSPIPTISGLPPADSRSRIEE